MIHTIINYLSYLPLIFPFLIILIFLKYRNIILKKKIILSALVLFSIATLFLIYGRFIETNNIKIQRTDIEVGFNGRIVLISDLHIGTFAKSRFVESVVNKVNTINDVDAVIIAGDLTYYPKENLNNLLYPLRDLKYPVLAVLGNHDTGHPGPDIKEELEITLKELGVTLLRNSTTQVEGVDIIFLGLGELWDNDVDIRSIEEFQPNDNLIVIAHNPDTIYKYRKNIADITLSGHTHGGQIRIPFIYKYFIPSKYGFDKGIYNNERGKVFVSSGLGLTGLPYRFGIRPVIDILNLY